MSLKGIALLFIRLYRKTAFLHRTPLKMIFMTESFCRFQPTCSEYTYQAIEKYGAVKGMWLGFKRILRCHPFSKGGYEPLK